MVTLRKLTKEDLPKLAEYANNKKIWDNLRDMMPHPYSREDADFYYDMVSKHETQQNFAIDYGAQFVGMIGVHPQADVYRKSAEIGYWIGEPFWGKGIATEATKQLVNYAFENLDIVRLYAGIFSFNPASGKVLEKAGFQKEGINKKAVFKNGTFTDQIMYGLVK